MSAINPTRRADETREQPLLTGVSMSSLRAARATSPMVGSLLVLGMLGGCNTNPTSAAPIVVPALPSDVARIALTVDVPTAATRALDDASTLGQSAMSPTLAAARPAMPGWRSTFGSLLGVDGVAVEIGRIDRSVLGQYAPGKVRVFVRLRLKNALDRTRLLTPTFPMPPAGDGVYLFAVQSIAVESPGGVTTGRNVVTVAAPSHGAVHPGPEWEGAPYDYVRSSYGTCAMSSTCARWKRFDVPLAPGGLSEWRTASYDIDPTVHHMRLRFVVAADLANR